MISSRVTDADTDVDAHSREESSGSSGVCNSQSENLEGTLARLTIKMLVKPVIRSVVPGRSDTIVDAAETVRVPLSIPFLLLRASNYMPNILEPFRKTVEQKLQILRSVASEGRNHTMQSYMLDLEEVMKRFGHQAPSWIKLLCAKLRNFNPNRTLATQFRGQSAPAMRSKTTQRKKRPRRTYGPSTPLSSAEIWQQQKAYYCSLGLKAWSSGAVPYHISSSPVIARIYTNYVMSFLERAFKMGCGNSSEPMSTGERTTFPSVVYVFELGAGHCKLGYLVARNLRDEYLKRGGSSNTPKVCVVMADLSPDVIKDRMRLSCMKPLLRDGLVDFACLDTANRLESIKLMHSGRTIRKSSLRQPFVTIGNYLLDSLPIDIYRYAPTTVNNLSREIGKQGKLQRLSVALPVDLTYGEGDETTSRKSSQSRSWKQWSREAMFNWTDSSLAQLVEDCTGNIFSEATEHYAEVLRNFASPEGRLLSKGGMHSPFIVPVGAVRLVRDIAELHHPSVTCPHMCIFGDKTFGSKESACLEFGADMKQGNNTDGEAPPIIVHHGLTNDSHESGCISVSVNLDLVSDFVELGKMQCSSCKRVHIQDRVSGSGGQFDVAICCSICCCSNQNNTDGPCFKHSQSELPRTSPTDVEAIAEIAVASPECWTPWELLCLLKISEYDALLFKSICWFISHKLRFLSEDITADLATKQSDHNCSPRAQDLKAMRYEAKHAALRCLENAHFEVLAPSGSPGEKRGLFDFALLTARFLYTIQLWNASEWVLVTYLIDDNVNEKHAHRLHSKISQMKMTLEQESPPQSLRSTSVLLG